MWMFWFNLTHNLRPYGHIYCGTDWSIFADARVLTKSSMANFLIQIIDFQRFFSSFSAYDKKAL